MPVRRLRGERGATTEMVIILPALLFLIFLGIQFALWFHASHLALAAAQEGARAARVANATDPVSARGAEQTGEDTANQFASQELIPPGEYQHIRDATQLTPDSIKHAAEQLGVSAGIVVGRLQRLWEVDQLWSYYAPLVQASRSSGRTEGSSELRTSGRRSDKSA